MDMRAPGIAAPVSPLTVPVIDPPATCAWMEHGAARTKSRQSAAAIRTVAVPAVLVGFPGLLLNEMKLVCMKSPKEQGTAPSLAGRSPRFCNTYQILLRGHHRARSQIVVYNCAALHHEFHPLHLRDVRQRISGDSDYIGELSLLDGAEGVLLVNDL